jgi:hypothetical protein
MLIALSRTQRSRRTARDKRNRHRKSVRYGYNKNQRSFCFNIIHNDHNHPLDCRIGTRL